MASAELPPDRCRELWRRYAGLPEGHELLLAHPSLKEEERNRMRRAPSIDCERLEAKGIRMITEPEYPETLGSLNVKYPALFVDGDWSVLSKPTIAIVGTRSASAYGRAVAQKFAEAFAHAGVTVVSGGALGIDAAAHKGAMKAGGSTVAVFANGVDVTYPRAHAGLFMDIRQQGCLVSQFSIGAMAKPYLFLARNSLIAALSKAVLVVEAPERSGALATAGAANEFNRDVYVVPANIDNDHFRGSHGLIRDGAILVEHPDQVLESLGIEPKKAPMQDQTPLSEIATRVLAALTTEPLNADRISERTGISAADVLSELTFLEIDGRVQRSGAGYAVTL